MNIAINGITASNDSLTVDVTVEGEPNQSYQAEVNLSSGPQGLLNNTRRQQFSDTLDGQGSDRKAVRFDIQDVNTSGTKEVLATALLLSPEVDQTQVEAVVNFGDGSIEDREGIVGDFPGSGGSGNQQPITGSLLSNVSTTELALGVGALGVLGFAASQMGD